MGEGKTMRFLSVLSVLAVGLVAAASASAAEYETYVGCGSTASSPPSHTCTLGDSPGAFFEADEDTEYEVCVEFPDFEFLCAEEQSAEAGVLYVNEMTTEELGEHFVAWYVEGIEVGNWVFDVIAPPPPPAPPAAPAPVAPAPPAIAPVTSPACVAARGHVRSLSARLRKATSHKAKVRLRAKLKRARAAVKGAC
jgi:hypothetical protein